MPNMGDVLVITVLAIVVTFVIRSMWKDRKEGKCCSGCSGCSGNCGNCHSK